MARSDRRTSTTGRLHRPRWWRRRSAIAAVAAVGLLGIGIPTMASNSEPAAAAANIPTCAVTATFTESTNSCLLPAILPPPNIPAVVTNGTRVTFGFPDRLYFSFPPIPGCPAGIGDPKFQFGCSSITPNRSGLVARVLSDGSGVITSPSVYGFTITRTRLCTDGEVVCDYVINFNPALVKGTVTILLGHGVKGNGTPLEGWDTSFVLSDGTGVPPITSFDATPDSEPGDWRFSATSTDPQSLPLVNEWDFGDGTTGTGTLATHTYDAPGTYEVTLTSRNTLGKSSTKTKEVVVEASTLGLSIDLLGGAVPPLDTGEPVDARVTVSASDDGLGAIDDIRFDGDSLLAVDPSDAFLITDGPTPSVPTSGFSLEPGQTRTFDVTIEPQILGPYVISSAVSGTDALDDPVTAEATSPGEIGQALDVSITLDPPDADQDEGPDGPVPIDVTATVTFENTTSAAMDEVTLTSLRVDRTQAGQLLAVTQTGGADPGDDGLEIGSLAPGEEKSVTATFQATDDAEVEFSALATGRTAGGRSVIGIGKKRWSVKPKYLLGLTTRVTNPNGSELLPAGELIRVAGTVKNLSTSATVEVGPLYPTLSGNAGVMSLAWDSIGTDPNALIPVGNITLGPSESRDFTVRVLTSWSDPTRVTGPGGSAGTRADLTFTPHGTATLEDGTEVAIEADDIKATAADLTHRVAIDDSISIPTLDPLAWSGAVSVGLVQGLGTAAASMVTGLVDLAKAPYTVTSAVYAAQSQIWNSFTPAEQEAFANEVSFMTVSVLLRNAEYAARESGELFAQVKASTGAIMTELANEWEVGDYTRTAQTWSRWGGDAVGQVMIPVALARMARSPQVVGALARAQAKLQARMRPVVTSSLSATRLEELGPLLSQLASGTELAPNELAQLFGISVEEYAELKRLADKYGVLMTVRSRHASSIDWIERFQALLKPEQIKIKSVSELDVKLGYPANTTGSLVFKKPEPLKVFDTGSKDLREAIYDFVRSKGFNPDTVDGQNAVVRMIQRSGEWRKWEKTYKRWDDQGWIDVSFNYKGNAIDDTIRKGRSGLGVAPLSSGKYKGFRLRQVGDEEYILEMFNGKVGRFVPVTGDIDPLAFTYLDGAPLTAATHADLLDDMIASPLLEAPHGESATYTGGGLDFIESQFKPGEGLLQIAPGDSAARVVRFNKGDSRWESPFDYNLKWDGGFTYAGSYVPRTATPRPPVVVPAAVAAPVARVSAIPQAVDAEPNVGRCRITFGTATTNSAAVVDASGKLRRLSSGGTTSTDDSLHSECFSPGPTVEKVLKPVTGLLEGAEVGDTRLVIPDDPFLATAGDGLEVGDEVLIGAGTPEAETRAITGFGSIIVDSGLQRSWPAGTIIVVIRRPSGGPLTSTTSTTTTTTTTTVPSTVATTAPATSGAGGTGGSGSGSGGDLPRTGSDPVPALTSAIVLLLAGSICVVWSRRRRMAEAP